MLSSSWNHEETCDELRGMLRAKKNTSKKAFWDVLLVQDDGKWFAFRSPWANLQNFATYFSVILIFAIFSTFGWFFSRWKVERLEDDLMKAQLNIRALKDSQLELREGSHEGVPKLGQNLFEELPLSLNKYNSSKVSAHELQAKYTSKNKSVSVLVRMTLDKKYEQLNLRWVLLLSGMNGLFVHPAVYSLSEEGPLDLDSAIEIELKDKESVKLSEKVFIPEYLRKMSAEAYWVHSVFYDQKGKIVSKTHSKLSYGAEQ